MELHFEAYYPSLECLLFVNQFEALPNWCHYKHIKDVSDIELLLPEGD